MREFSAPRLAWWAPVLSHVNWECTFLNSSKVMALWASCAVPSLSMICTPPQSSEACTRELHCLELLLHLGVAFLNVLVDAIFALRVATSFFRCASVAAATVRVAVSGFWEGL